MMLNLYRRHLKRCPHRPKGRKHRKCECPIWVEGSLGGVPLHHSLLTTSWPDAVQISRSLEAGEQPQSSVMLTTAIESFQADNSARGLTADTVKKYRQVLERLQAWCADNGLVWLEQINVPAIRDFRSTWKVAPITSNKMLERVRSFFWFCVNSGWMPANPAAAVRRAKEEQPPTMPFTDAELAAIEETLERHAAGKQGAPLRNALRLRALVRVLLYTGLRISDAVMLRQAQIDGDCVHVRQAKTKTPVRIPVPPVMLEALAAIEPSANGYYFSPGPSNPKTRAGDWRRRLRWLFRTAKVADGHAHRFRDTLAVRLLQAGVPIDRVSQLLGHTSIKTTEKHYAPWVLSRQKQFEEEVRATWRSA